MQELIEQAWNNRELLQQKNYTDAIEHIIEELDKGRMRIAEPKADAWQVNDWAKQAVMASQGEWRKLRVFQEALKKTE